MTAIDRRSSEARLLRKVETGLTEQLGGNPSPAQQLLIHNVAVLSMRFEVLHRSYCETGKSSAHADKFLISLATVTSRILIELGLEPRRAAGPSLAQYLEMKVANG